MASRRHFPLGRRPEILLVSGMTTLAILLRNALVFLVVADEILVVVARCGLLKVIVNSLVELDCVRAQNLVRLVVVHFISEFCEVALTAERIEQIPCLGR